MKVAKPGPSAGVALAALLLAPLAAACGSDNGSTAAAGDKSKSASADASASASGGAAGGACGSGSLSGAGSSFQLNIQQQWAKDFAAQCSGAQVAYQGVGSGAGIEQFGSGTVDFAGSDVPMKPEEQAKADKTCGSKAIHVPVTAGGVAVIYNLPGVSSLNLSAKTIAAIFSGGIKSWSDPAIKADNPSAKLPSTPIAAYHRSDGSGTTAVLADFLTADAKSSWKLGTGKELSWPTGAGQGAKGSDGVTAGVKQTKGGITYAELSFAKANALPYAKVKGAGSSFVELTGTNVNKGIEAFGVTGTGNDVAGKIDYAKITDGYPLSTVSYVIACTKGKDAAKSKLLKSYLTYAISKGQDASEGLGYAPLPMAVVAKAKTAVTALS